MVGMEKNLQDITQKRNNFSIFVNMNKVHEQIAKTCHAVHRAYCNESLLPTQPEWDSVDDNHKQVIIDSVKKIFDGEITSKEQSHNNFVAMKKSQGWTFGNYSMGDKKNPRLVPFEQLNIHDKIKENLFFETVKSFI